MIKNYEKINKNCKSFRASKLKTVNYDKIYKSYSKIINKLNLSESNKLINYNINKTSKIEFDNINKNNIEDDRDNIIKKIERLGNYEFSIDKNIYLYLDCSLLIKDIPLLFKIRTNNIYKYDIFLKNKEKNIKLKNEFEINENLIKENYLNKIIIIIRSIHNKLNLFLIIKSKKQLSLFNSKEEFNKFMKNKLFKDKFKKNSYINIKKKPSKIDYSERIKNYKIKKRTIILEDINRKIKFGKRNEINKIKREKEINDNLENIKVIILVKNFIILIKLKEFYYNLKNEFFIEKLKKFKTKMKLKFIVKIQTNFKSFYFKNKKTIAFYKKNLFFNSLKLYKSLNIDIEKKLIKSFLKQIYLRIKFNEQLKFYRIRALIIKNKLKQYIFKKKNECNNFYLKLNKIMFNLYQYSKNKSNKFSNIINNTKDILKNINQNYLKRLISFIYEYYLRNYINEKYKIIHNNNIKFNYKYFNNLILKKNFSKEYILIDDIINNDWNKLWYLDIINYNIKKKNKIKRLKKLNVLNKFKIKFKKEIIYDDYNLPNNLKLKLMKHLNKKKEFKIENYFKLDKQYFLILKILKNNNCLNYDL